MMIPHTMVFVLSTMFVLPTLIGGCSATDDDSENGIDDGIGDGGTADGGDTDTTTVTAAARYCATESGEHHNYFLDVGHTAEEVAAKVDGAWQQLFHGDPELEAVYFESDSNENGPLAYIMDVASDDVRSEGMSYGMMIAVQLDKKPELDALWNWAKTFMWHGEPTHPYYEYFSWSLNTDGTPKSEGPAPDGEEYFATALYFASGRWGNGAGIYNYRAEADRIVSAMRNRPPINGTYEKNGARQQATGVSMFHPDYKMVRFSPNEVYFSAGNGDHTDPSYHVPAFYTYWAAYGPEADRPFYSEAAAISRNFFQTVAHPVTALTPDYARFDGTPLASYKDANTAAFRSDAQRTAMNWSVDYAWWCADEGERALSDKLQDFFVSQGEGYQALYQLDGTPFPFSENYSSTGLVAMNAVTALAATDPERSEWFVDALWNRGIPRGTYRYYDGMLYMLGLLHVSGQFRIYPPQ